MAKKINERLKVYEEAGLTDVKRYRDLQAKIDVLGLPTVTSKKGYTHISVSAKSETPERLAQIKKIEKMGGISQDIKKAKKEIRAKTVRSAGGTRKKVQPSQKEVFDTIREISKRSTFFEDHLQEIYNLAQESEVYANVLDDLQSGNVRHMSMEDFNKLMDDVANEENRLKDVAERFTPEW
jgi:hypothetical protein